MAVEFYMTNGEFLAIGQLVCSCCKVKSLKGLDFTNSYIIPEAGHPLQPELTGSPPVQELPVAIKKEAEEAVEVRSDEVPAKRKLVARDLSAHRDVVLPGVPSAPGKPGHCQVSPSYLLFTGKLATIQPFPHRAQARIVATSSLNLSSASQQTPKNNPGRT